MSVWFDMAEDPDQVRCCCCGLVKKYDNPTSWRELCVMTARSALMPAHVIHAQELAREGDDPMMLQFLSRGMIYH